MIYNYMKTKIINLLKNGENKINLLSSDLYNVSLIKTFNLLKILIILFLIILIIKLNKTILFYNININESYYNIQKTLNLTFNNNLLNKIRIGIYAYCLKNGGRARITSILINYLNKIKIFRLFLYTKEKREDNEYKLPNHIKRKVVKNDIIDTIIKYKIEVLIYQLSDNDEINELNKLNKTKVIYYLHSSLFYWIYRDFSNFKALYQAYTNSKYVVSLIPLENDYIFKKWGINSILMNNFITYEYDSIEPSDLSSKIIIMIGRANDKLKRFEIGIKSMEFIIKEVPDCEMKIISELKYIDYLQEYVNNELKLESYIKFVGFTLTPEIYFKNSSLHIFPTISEAFPMVLCETKIYGIPNILVGLDYISIAKGGTIIIYDDEPQSIANEAIKILKNNKYRKKLGEEARNSMKIYNNDLLFIKWIKLILCVFNGDSFYQNLREQDSKISKVDALNMIKNQIKLLNIRKKNCKNMTINQLENFTLLKEIECNE